ncbi:MAG: hypothetical protein RMK91_06470 [Pseudanabaenaceae cyanobacterium SKYGB_i_bin29]|nr:hypothetical protein [Pseudanabaenaceae cyanobacterium SKYG29]MDW8421496.1 hypothetical protein [Pseudanabaenaceae cyanobacterium SKYGB_i_bin29]
MRLLMLAPIVIVLPLQAQLLTPLAPAPVIPSTTPGLSFPRGRDKTCPDGTALNPRLGRCLPTREGRSLLREEALDVPTNADGAVSSSDVPVSPAVAKLPNAKQLVQEATESCQAYPGTVPTPMLGGYACLPRK